MAIFCPACPQPNVNLPNDWKDRYTKYVAIPYLVFAYAIYLIIHLFKGTSSSGPSLWMETSQQSICDAGLGKGMFHFLQGWHSWQIQHYTKPISKAVKKLFRYVGHPIYMYPISCIDALNSQVHVIHTRPLSKQTPVGLTWMSQALGQPLVVMGSLFLAQWWISRRVKGVSNQFVYPMMHMMYILTQAN